jgi:SAM-dependent methyltransferase
MAEFSRFDKRGYPTLGVREGYAAWAPTYETTVSDLMDLRLLARLRTVAWGGVERAIDLACGTGRGGGWLKSQGVKRVDGVDFTEEMLAKARAREVYEDLHLADVAATGLREATYELATQLLADEHMADLAPIYREAGRLLAPGGRFVLVGFHPWFLMSGMPTHFDRAPGEPVAIESHVHLFSDHVRAAHSAGLRLAEMEEGVVDDDWVALKPKWTDRRDRPVSFAMVWEKPLAGREARPHPA